MKTSKTKKILDEASYYTGQYSGSQSPETVSAYEFAKDSVPTLNKLSGLKDKDGKDLVTQELPFPLQDSIKELANLYLMAQDLRNKSREASKLPSFKGKEAELDKFRKQLNGIMVSTKKLAAQLGKFSLAPK